MSETPCPRCGNPSSSFQSLEGGLLAKLQESGTAGELPSQVCEACYTQLAGSVARGSLLLAREKAKERKKLDLWNSRVGLIKKARHSMQEKAFSEAAVAYEKYIKVLEVVFGAESGELKPEQFKDAARTQELTIVASVYWDLLRIYDTSTKYSDRQAMAAKKLAQFLRYTPIFPDILRKAQAFSRTAKNRNAIKTFLKAADESRGRCFIATSAFGSTSREVQILSNFRDQNLAHSPWGRAFILTYYKLSPMAAQYLDNHPQFKPLVRRSLRKFIDLLESRKNSACRHDS